ncbi:hypothetical protein PSAC2689_30370 [Paraburkholderia sacchari]
MASDWCIEGSDRPNRPKNKGHTTDFGPSSSENTNTTKPKQRGLPHISFDVSLFNIFSGHKKSAPPVRFF